MQRQDDQDKQQQLKEPLLNDSDKVGSSERKDNHTTGELKVDVESKLDLPSVSATSQGFFSRNCSSCPISPKWLLLLLASLIPLIGTGVTDCFSAMSLERQDNHCNSDAGQVFAALLVVELFVLLGVGFSYVPGHYNRRP